MALQTSGAISLSQIRTEFQGTPWNLGSYYRGGGLVTSNNTNVPTSGLIRFSNFYGADRFVGNVTNNFDGINITGIASINGSASATVTFNPDGTVVASTTGAVSGIITVNRQWFSPTTAGIGNSYWIMSNNDFQFISGTPGGLWNGLGQQTSPWAAGTWWQLSQARAWTTLAAGLNTSGTRFWTLTFQISSSPTGTPVLAVGSVVINARKNS